MKGFIDSHIISHLGKVACACKTCGTGTDDCDLMTVFDLRSLWFDSILLRAVSYKTLELSDGDRFGLQTADALSFTLGLLRANTAADSGKRTRFGDDLISSRKIFFCNFLDKSRNIDTDGASLDAACILAVQTSAGFLYRFLFIISVTDFIKVLGSDKRLLLSYRDLRF